VHSQQASFGAGCFWGAEKFFRKQFADGLIAAKVGTWADRKTQNPNYKEVCADALRFFILFVKTR